MLNKFLMATPTTLFNSSGQMVEHPSTLLSMSVLKDAE